MKNRSNIGNAVKRVFFIGLTGVLVGFLLIIFVYLLPTAPMKTNLQKSAKELETEGEWPILISGYSSTVLDNYTESIMLSIAIYDNEQSVWVKAMKNYYAMQSAESLASDSLYAYLKDEACYGENYARYWHGYLVILKPLLLLFSYSDLRILNIIVLTLLVAYVTSLLKKNISTGAGAVFLLAVAFLMPLTMYLCLDMANMLYVTLFAIIILLKKKDYWQEDNNALVYFFIIGMLTSYMDFLTYPLITLGIPLATYIVLLSCDRNQVLNGQNTILSMIFWGLGYGGMWSAKWILASLISGENFILDALRSVKIRSGLQTTDDGLLGRMQAIKNNIDILSQGVYGKALIVLIAVLFGYLLWNKIKHQTSEKLLWPLLFVAVIPLAWLFVTNEHSSLHAWFTYRNLVVSIYALGMLGIRRKI